MPPLADDHVQALHLLNVVEHARAFIAEVVRCGGFEHASLTEEGVRAAMKALFDETSKLQVHEARAAARGTLVKLTGAQLMSALKTVRDARVLSAGEREVLAATPEEVADTFSLDAEPEPVEFDVAEEDFSL